MDTAPTTPTALFKANLLVNKESVQPKLDALESLAELCHNTIYCTISEYDILTNLLEANIH